MVVVFIREVIRKMSKKYIRVVFWGVVTCGVFSGILYTEKNNISAWNTLLGIIIAYTMQWCVTACIDCTDNSIWKEQLRMFMRKQIIKRDDPIRISFAYLFRIKVDGKYLLVPNGRGTGKYQPVGGAYKTTEKEKTYLKEKFYLSEDDKIKVDASSKNDYRMFVPASKLKAFVKRFDKTVDREQVKNLKREFREELITTDIFDFREIRYRYCGRHLTSIEFSRHFRCYELLLADIVELLPTQEPENRLRELMNTSSDEYYFATKDEIEHCGIVEGTDNLKEVIADHSFKVLEETEQYLKRIKKDKGIYEVEL